MSIECLNQALKIEGLSPTKKLILVLLANYADEENTCYPSYKHIAKIVGLKTTKGIQKAIKEFEELGLLKVEHRILENGSYTSNKYHLILGGGLKEPTPQEDTRLGSQKTNNTKDNTKTSIYNKYSDDFEKFWICYPRKVAKDNASKSFEKIKFNKRKIDTGQEVIPFTFDLLLSAVDQFAEENRNTEEKYIVHASTWLNQNRYLDYLTKDTRSKRITNLAG